MSFSIDTTQLLDVAAQMFNGLAPIAWVVGGLSLGVGLVFFVVRVLKNIF